MILNPNKKLQTFDHEDAVKEFMRSYRLSPRSPNLIFLEEILERFANLPYENLSKIIKLNKAWESPEKIRLPEEVLEDHLAYRLGGTCFSLTFYLQTILEVQGFRCYPVMADMKAGPNIHCCLIVILDGTKYLVDPGYLLTRPMEINPQKPRLFRTEFTGVELRYDHQTQRYNLYTFNRNEIKWRYRFQDRPVPPEEFLQHWLASFRWNTMHALCLTKVQKDSLIFVHNTFMRETNFVSKKNYNLKKNFHKTIQQLFGIDQQLIEQAQVALQENLARERALGLWKPKNR